MLKWLGRIGLVLLLALLLGLAIGTWLRMRFERPVYYIGAADARGSVLPSLACGESRFDPPLLSV